MQQAGLKHREIAEKTGMPLPTVAGGINKAKKYGSH
jgi:hypothetical protein